MTTNTTQLVAEARSRVENLELDAVAHEIADGALLIDLREAAERRETGAIPGAVHVPRGLLEFKADPSGAAHLPDLDPGRRTILYCATGGRSALAVLTLEALGYADVAHLASGIQGWIAAGRGTEVID